MKKILCFVCFLLSLEVIAQQKHEVDFTWPQRRVMGGLSFVYGLGENGTVFYEQVVLNAMSAAMKLTYVSADGKTTWVSDKLKHIARDCQVLSDNAGFTVYDLENKTLHSWRFNYKGDLGAKAEVKFDLPVLALFQSGKKVNVLLESVEKQVVRLFVQELNPATFNPVGARMAVELPESSRYIKVKSSWKSGEVVNHWVFAGSDEARLAFYGKKVSLENSVVTFDIVITDHRGKKQSGFTQTIGLQPGKYVNRSFKSQEHLQWSDWQYEYMHTEFPSPNTGHTYDEDPGTFGDCMIDWGRSAVFFYGTTGTAPEWRSPVTDDGYFIQKYSFSGAQEWQVEGELPKSDKQLFLSGYVRKYDEQFLINPISGNILYRRFPKMDLVLDAAGNTLQKKWVDMNPVKKDFSPVGQPYHFKQNMFGLYHQEIIQTQVLAQLFDAATAAAIQQHLEKYGHAASWYVFQVNQKDITVLETDPKSESYSLWTVPKR